MERLTYDAIARRALAPTDRIPQDTWAALCDRALVAVHVGATPDELMFAWRT
ncbi:hypothetical protein WEI85_07490 [Actinomycetes bacterium KLBMP 9797]